MEKQVVKPDVDNFSLTQRRSVAIAVVVALGFGAYLLRDFFTLIAVSAIVAFLFLPMYKRLNRKFSSAVSATITFFAAVGLVLLPVAGIIALAVAQITNTVDDVASWMSGADMGLVGRQIIDFINNIIGNVPYLDYELTEDSVRDAVGQFAQSAGNWLLGLVTGLLGGVFGFITTSIIFIYTFISMLVNHKKIGDLMEKLNPIGSEASRLYMQKAGAMIHGTVGGQFVIAAIQGFTGAASIYIAGFHEAFFVLALVFTLLSMIPLGSGIITIPFGIGMMLFGNIAGGLFVVLWHLLAVTNIDNILRPILVPKTARLDPALMLITVFAGLGMFGFWGIFIGPVIMILIVTTIKVYLATYKGVPLATESAAKPKTIKSKK